MAQNRRGDVGARDSGREQQPGRELLSAADVTRTIARIAHQIICLLYTSPSPRDS